RRRGRGRERESVAAFTVFGRCSKRLRTGAARSACSSAPRLSAPQSAPNRGGLSACLTWVAAPGFNPGCPKARRLCGGPSVGLFELRVDDVVLLLRSAAFAASARAAARRALGSAWAAGTLVR